jgi:hypothetical protein
MKKRARIYLKSKFKQQYSAFLCAGLISVIIFFFFNQNSFAQQKNSTSTKVNSTDTFDIKRGTFLMPQDLSKWKFSQAFSIYYVVLPKDWTLDIIKAPFFTYSCKLALPAAFNLQASFSTILVSNRLSAGPFWNYSINNFHFAAGYQVAFNYGYLSEFGFETKLIIWEQQPSLTAAYSFGKTAVILRGDLYYTSSVEVNQGGYDIPAHEHFLNGYSVTATFDQRLYKNKVMSLGLKMNYVRYHMIAWPALPVNSYRYIVPEFQIGLNL